MKIFLLICCMCCMMIGKASAPIDLYIVCNTDGTMPVMTGDAFTNKLPEINAYFAQVGMSFYLRAQSAISNDEYRVVAYGSEKADILRMSIPATGGVKLFAVERIGEDVRAFCGDYGIIFTPQCSANTLAHELGHACGLDDIYIQKTFPHFNSFI